MEDCRESDLHYKSQDHEAGDDGLRLRSPVTARFHRLKSRRLEHPNLDRARHCHRRVATFDLWTSRSQLRNPALLADRIAQIDQPHVAPLNAWVRDLRKRLGPDSIVPWFDPADGGTNATILWLLEAPGPKATPKRNGSGLISCNNDDQTAENTWRTREEAGVPRSIVAHWNVIPGYIGSDTKIRAANPGDIAAAGPLLTELLGLLPALRVVILGGDAARLAWKLHAPEGHDLTVIDAPHPSATNLNTRPGNRPKVVAAWVQARTAATR